MYYRIISFCLSLCLALSLNAHTVTSGSVSIDIERPNIPSLQASITDFGGVGDGHTLNSKAFEEAISYLSQKGGGTLIVPSGIWFTGPIQLKSRIRLLLKNQAVVKFSPDYRLYGQTGEIELQSPLYAVDATDIEICGDGLFDGSGELWRPYKKQNATESEWKRKLKTEGALNVAGDRFYPMTPEEQEYFRNHPINKHAGEADQWMRAKDYLRPELLHFVRCNRVSLCGNTYINSPGWNLHPELTTNLVLKNVTVKNDNNAANGDGIDIESCQKVHITQCRFDVGDDGICIKSGLNEAGRKRGIPTADVIIDSCTVYHAHGGFVVGSEMSGGVRNIAVSACRFIGTDNGLRFKANRERGGVVENIYVNNIYMDRIVSDAVLFDLFYGGTSGEDALDNDPSSFRKNEIPAAIGSGTPTFRNIQIDGIICLGTGRAFYFDGLPELPIENITINNMYAKSLAPSLISQAKNLALKNITLEGNKTVYLNGVAQVEVDKTNKADIKHIR